MSRRRVNPVSVQLEYADIALSVFGSLAVFAIAEAYFRSVLSDVDLVIVFLVAYVACIAGFYIRRLIAALREAAKGGKSAREAVAESRRLREELENRPVAVAVIDKDRSQRNVVRLPADVMKNAERIAEKLVTDGSAISRRSMMGILNRADVAAFQNAALDGGLAERKGKAIYLTDKGRVFFARFLPAANPTQDAAATAQHSTQPIIQA